MIALNGVALDIGGRRLLEGIDARIESGELLAVVGPNGVGKTTLLRAIAGLHAPSSGTIDVGGSEIGALTPMQRALRLGFVTSDDVMLDALRVRDVVAIGRFAHHRWWEWRERTDDDDAVREALAAIRMESFAERLFSTLSSGERQRVWIAMGLAQATPVLLLDEPTSHLDLRVAHQILALLRELARGGKTIVCAIHDVNDAAAYANRIALLGDGRLVALDTPDRVLASDVLETTYRVAMERVRLSGGSLRVFAREA
ncbi:MAG TPA: ABC transporter ATP-binding protein [Candidatus Baltobacteraceae bacterium]|jgi:iron complex transport system ATP-binding protein|nr:ABC transporter ATP-binding protein [Candidatus Baltobacteraceae bacterium]